MGSGSPERAAVRGAGLGAVLTLVLLGTYALLVLIGQWSNLVVASGVTASHRAGRHRRWNIRRHEVAARSSRSARRSGCWCPAPRDWRR